MSFRLGLTGSIGMGKSATAAMFADEGIPVWDADATVHRLYLAGQAGALAVAAEFPGAIAPDGSVDRAALLGQIQSDPDVLGRLNAIIHPLVAQDRATFLDRNDKAAIVLLDIPLLYETGLEDLCDAVVVVSAPADIQRARVLARGMNVAAFDAILARQIPDSAKRARADHVIPTTSLAAARAAVKNVLADIQRRIAKDA